MTNNFINLVKINFKSMFITSFGGKFSKSKKTSILVIALLFIFIIGVMGFQFYTTADLYVSVGLSPSIIFYNALFYAILICGMFTVIVSMGSIFKAKDYEQLASLPIKSIEISMSKMVSIMLSAYLYSAIILLPAIIVYFLFVQITLLSFLSLLIGLILFPIVPVAISLIIGFIVSFISSKFKYANILTIILLVALTGLAVYLSTIFNEVTVEALITGSSIANNIWVKIFLSNYSFFMLGSVAGNWLQILYFALSSVAILTITTFVLALLYNPVNKMLFNAKVNDNNKKSISFKVRGHLQTLFSNEIKKFFSLPIYVLNSCFSLIILIALPFLLKFNLFQIDGVGLSLNLDTLLLIAMASGLVASMATTTNSSISLEGKNLYIVKSLPYSNKTIFASKILVNLVVVLPFILLSWIFNIIFFYNIYFSSGVLLGILYIFLSLAIPLFAVLAFSTFGLLINLLFPKLNFTNVAMVVKQSISVFITLFSSMLSGLIILILCGTKIIPIDNIYWLLIQLTMYVLLFIISTILINRKGNKLFNKLEV